MTRSSESLATQLRIAAEIGLQQEDDGVALITARGVIALSVLPVPLQSALVEYDTLRAVATTTSRGSNDGGHKN